MRTSLAVRLVLAVSVFCSVAIAQSPPATQRTGAAEQALRSRVQEFYSLLQVGKFSDAEKYITEDSKENFRYQQRGPFLAFEIKTVKLDADGKGAMVQVMMQTLTPSFSSTPVPMPSNTHWKLVDGGWYAVVPKPDPNALKTLFAAPGSGTVEKPASPPPEELKFKGHTYNFANFPQGTVKEARFPFKNVTDHTVTITEVATGCDCLKAKLPKKQYAPGESGELTIQFDSTDYPREYGQTIAVKTDPGDVVTLLNVRGYAIPRPRQTSKPAQESSEAKKPL